MDQRARFGAVEMRYRVEEKIDFVITWVDGGDAAWLQDKARFKPDLNTDDEMQRYRDWGLLKYWFRGVENFAPWVNRIHFVTWGHLPEWLDTTNPKLQIVRHEDFIPREYLPTFNSNVIEIYMHKIPGLSDHFVYFNDDIYLINPIAPDYFFKHGKPVDMLAFQPVVANPKNPVMSHLYLNNSLAICRHFDKRSEVKAHPGNYFKIGYPPMYFFYNILEMAFPQYTGFYTVHNASPFLRKTFEEVWEKEGDALKNMSANRFRSAGDLTPYLFREWQKLTGNFVPGNILKDFEYFNLSVQNTRLLKTVRGNKKKMICINDGDIGDAFERVRAEFEECFAAKLPRKSAFER